MEVTRAPFGRNGGVTSALASRRAPATLRRSEAESIEAGVFRAAADDDALSFDFGPIRLLDGVEALVRAPARGGSRSRR
jgi:hypothetical protein